MCYASVMFEGIAIVGILIMSIVLHEVAHGWMANALGDPTAKLQGGLTASPVSHIDPIGSVLIPGFLYFSGAGFLFGWAKPVPYNPHQIRSPFGWHHKWAEFLVAAAGPGMNIILALFNLIPFPPLDGSKMLSTLLPRTQAYAYDRFLRRVESYGMFASLLFIFVFITFFSKPFFAFVTTVVATLTQ